MEYYSHFNKLSFWRDYYESKGLLEHDWLQNYSQLVDIFRIACQDKKNINNLIVLDIGCGTSSVLQNLYKKGFDKLIGIDYCKSVIDHMNNKFQKVSDKFEFYEMNALETKFQDCQFDIIFDKVQKSGWDARQNSQIYLKEINRILKNNGKYILITHGNIEQREKYFKQIENYNKKIFKLYRTTIVEEEKYIRDELLSNNNQQLEKEEFCKILNQNLSKIDTQKVKNQNFHFGIIFEKIIEDQNKSEIQIQDDESNIETEKNQRYQLISNYNKQFHITIIKRVK